jgi:electron-transferring-flavoprotein dehydrogenase
MGWPLRKAAKWNEFGGSFIYPMGEDKLCIGLVVGLDYTDSTFSVHDGLQQLKTHPFVKKLLEGGKRVAWGAKTIPSGGYFSMPRSLAVPGMVIAGDAASMVNVPTLKGVHYAIRAGMLAAESIVDGLKRDDVSFSSYHEAVHKSEIGQDLFASRNMRAPFSKGFFVGGAVASAMTITQGAFPGGKWEYEPDTEIEMRDGGAGRNYPEADNQLTFNKLDSVFLSGNATRDDAPNHVRIQSHVPRELAKTWVSLCPAQVYEIPEDQLENGAQTVDVHVTASNCVQCGAINAKGGRLTMPEGGDGPLYQET